MAFDDSRHPQKSFYSSANQLAAGTLLPLYQDAVSIYVYAEGDVNKAELGRFRMDWYVTGPPVPDCSGAAGQLLGKGCLLKQ
jgi:hypothetical protein